ncbi:MAG: 4-hydroxy-3-methylbut-2-enyl diphosphate reductase [Anaeroplasmataceae bacterium]
MIINKLSPQGYCKGVISAIDIANNIKDAKTPIYSLGALIHNKKMVEELKKKGIITIDDKSLTRLEMLDKINAGSIIISAHGVAPKVYEKAKEKGLQIIDATCGYVKMTHMQIKKHLDLGYDVYYIGALKHPECEGAIGISNKIKLITSMDDIDKYTFIDKSFIINQTTLSLYQIDILHKKIKEKNPNVKIAKSICNATTLRQNAVINSKVVDLTIIVGDKSSSNSLKLFELAQKINKALMIETVKDLYDYDFTNIKEINITSGASTPDYITSEVIDYLKAI